MSKDRNITIVYYTSNREKEGFENKVRQTLLEAIEGLPLISVSQKPIDFGKNICVGDIGATPENMLKQVRLGALEAETDFVGMAEADCLYHKSYFEFVPERDDTFYYPDKFYVLWSEKNHTFWLKTRREISSIVGRTHLVQVIDKILSESPSHISNSVPKLTRQEVFCPEISVITIKTRNGMHWATPHRKAGARRELPHWGRGRELLKGYL